LTEVFLFIICLLRFIEEGSIRKLLWLLTVFILFSFVLFSVATFVLFYFVSFPFPWINSLFAFFPLNLWRSVSSREISGYDNNKYQIVIYNVFGEFKQ